MSIPLIKDYANGGFTIGEEFYLGSVIIHGEDATGFTINTWKIKDAANLSLTNFAPIFELTSPPDLMLLGVGESMSHPFERLRVDFTAKGIPLEVQTTPAICRTWNLLLTEGRKIALAAIAIQN